MNKLPIAKRTRSGVDRMLYQRCLEQRGNSGKRVKRSGAGASVPEDGGVSEVKCVKVDWEDDGEEFSEVKKVESSKSRKSEGKSKSDKKIEKTCHASDVVLMLDSSSDSDDSGAEDEYLSEEEVDSDVMVVSVIDKGAESEEERVVADDVVVDDAKQDDAEFSDSSSSEAENFYCEESDETYSESSKSDHDDEGLDESSSSDESKDEIQDVSSDDVVECTLFREKSEIRGKGKERRVEGGEKRNKIGNRSCDFVDDDDTDEDNLIRKNARSVGRSNKERTVKRGLKKITGVRDFEVKPRIWERDDVVGRKEERIVKSGLKKRTEMRDFEVKSRIWERNDVVGRKEEERIVKSGLKKRPEVRDFEVKPRIWERDDVVGRKEERIVKSGLKKRPEVRDFEVKSRIWEGNDVGRKNEERIVKSGLMKRSEVRDFEVKPRIWEGNDVAGRKNEERLVKSELKKRPEVRDFEVKSRIWEGNDVVGRKNEETIVKSELKKRREVQDFDVKSRIWERNDVKCKGKERMVEVGHTKKIKKKPEVREVVEMLSSSDDDEIRGNFVEIDSRERRKQLAKKRKADENLDRLRILADSLHGKGETWKKFEKEKPKYKFWFKDEDEKPVEKSEFDKHVDELFKEMNMCLAFDEIGSTPLEVENGDHDHCTTQTDSATLCSQGIHHLVLDEQIGLICKYCSHVSQEMKHILPTLSKPSPQPRRRGYFVQSGCRIYSDNFRYTDAEIPDSENYDTTGTVWDLVPGVKRSMYEHQREGFEFIWKNLAGGINIEELEKSLSSSGSGCIISHAPGTGKTRLTIIFLQSFMKLYPDARSVIIAPKSMLLTWEEEFKKWNIGIPLHNLNNLEFSGQENPAALSVSTGRDSRNNDTQTRLVKLLSWKMDKSILGITYALFDKLVRDATKNADCSPIVEQMGKALLKLPSLLVLDEGHTPRNNQSSIYNSLLDVETQRRIILSGTPFQNNFDELYNTLRLVNPKFDGGMKKNLKNISKELKSKWSGQRLTELKGMISPFVHVHKGKILQQSCPGLKDALIRLQQTDLQQELIGIMSRKDLKAGYLELSYVVSLVSVHPSLLPKRYFEEPLFLAYRDKLEKLETDPYSGSKTKFVVELCRLSEALNEKVLIYSQYIDPLIFLKRQLQTYFGWTEGTEVLYMDGNFEAKQRQSLISSLNDPRSKSRVLLASIKACSEGIHLVGASRVVLLDVVWNPSVERQAISRAYRIGQKKIVYTYHLIGEEMDSKKFKVQTAKDRLSEIVFSSTDGDSCKENVQNVVCEDEILQKMLQHNDKLGGMFEQIILQPKESNLIDTFDLVAEELN